MRGLTGIANVMKAKNRLLKTARNRKTTLSSPPSEMIAKSPEEKENMDMMRS
jgi:hypothetical protein